MWWVEALRSQPESTCKCTAKPSLIGEVRTRLSLFWELKGEVANQLSPRRDRELGVPSCQTNPSKRTGKSTQNSAKHSANFKLLEKCHTPLPPRASWRRLVSGWPPAGGKGKCGGRRGYCPSLLPYKATPGPAVDKTPRALFSGLECGGPSGPVRERPQ